MIEDVRRIVCDRCKTEDIIRQNDHGLYCSPDGWTETTFLDTERDLCPKCSELHERFMDGYEVTGKTFYEVL